MSGWFELSQNDKEQFSFVLKAANNEVILRSQTYDGRKGAENGIASVRANSPKDELYERKLATDGKPYFNLRAANGQVIGTSQMYTADKARDNGIASVKSNGATQTIKDLTTKEKGA